MSCFIVTNSQSVIIVLSGDEEFVSIYFDRFSRRLPLAPVSPIVPVLLRVDFGGYP